jgi:hypothetical protein
MTLTNFIPAVWSARLLSNLHKALVYGGPNIVNHDYEGEISAFGDSVKINSIGAITVFDYTKNTDMPAAETLTDAQRTLVIDQAKGFNFQLDDVDKAQTKPKVMDEAMQEAAYALRDVADQFIAAKYVDADAGNLLGSTGSPVSIAAVADAYDNLVKLGVLLDNANIPSEGRFAVVPPWYEGVMLRDQRFVSFGTDANRGTLENGVIGRAAGFTISKSNNVPNTAGSLHRIIAGHRMAWSFADQVNSVEAYRPERRFGDAVKGLHLYGGKTVRPKALAVLTANNGIAGG